jgi:hypothetical protein
VPCGQTCADLATDEHHCGSCDNRCDPQFGLCRAGVCECTMGLVNCGGEGNRCRDLQNDPSRCGSCSTACEDDEYCEDGACACRPGLTACGETCVDTRSNDLHCGQCDRECTGQMDFCMAGVCAMGCMGPATACDPNQQSCVLNASMNVNPLHCGACDTACGRQEVCVQGECRPFVMALGCDTCPCSFCQAGSRCCTYPGDVGVLICLQGNQCPTIW